MLTLGGYFNLFIAVGHFIGLFWAYQMFEVTGIGKEMAELKVINSSLPYLLTIFVAIIFFIFGLYGLSADNKFRKLPFTKTVIFLISGIYIFRGLGELVIDVTQATSYTSETMYSLVALGIGLIFLFGGLKKWNSVPKKA